MQTIKFIASILFSLLALLGLYLVLTGKFINGSVMLNCACVAILVINRKANFN